MNKFTVTTKRPYDILIGQDILKDAGTYIRERIEPCKVCVVTDSKVNGLYSQVLISSLIENGFQTCKVVFPEGEHSKTINTYSNILEALADEGISRSDLIVALGGGVVGDLSGFAASTYMRGIKYIQVPTTYLAAVDSSVGGKTGLNLLSGKNLAGAFWQPSLVVSDYKTFDTLEEEELLDGVAEAVKSGMVAEKGLIDHVVSKDYSYVIERCVSIKKSIVEADERDTGMRQLLNFGHTIGHCIEKISSFSISHGHAVAKGMVAESKSAYRLGLTDTDTSGYLKETLENCGFDLSIPYDIDEMYYYALNDKKISGDSITVVVPESIGKCRLQKISLSELRRYIELGTE
jgi:3-dehydroquinate synthase